MNTGLVINGLASNGLVFKLKDHVSPEKALENGKNDGLDQVYFTDGKNNYVLQGDDLQLGEIKEKFKNAQSATVQLEGKNVEVKFLAVDDEVTSFTDGLIHNRAIATNSMTAIGVGAPVAALSGLGWLVTEMAGSALGSKIASSAATLGAAAVVGGVAGLVYYVGKSEHQNIKSIPDYDRNKEVHEYHLGTDNQAPLAGRFSTAEKTGIARQFAIGVATEVILDGVLSK